MLHRPPRPPLFPYTTLFRSPSRRPSLGYCSSQASKYEWPPSSPVFSFCHLLWAWSQVLASRRHSTIRSSRSEEHTSELQSRRDLVCRLLLEKKKERRETVSE